MDYFILYLLLLFGIQGTIENPWTSILQLILFTTAIETVVEAIVSPVTARFVKHLRSKSTKSIKSIKSKEEFVNE